MFTPVFLVQTFRLSRIVQTKYIGVRAPIPWSGDFTPINLILTIWDNLPKKKTVLKHVGVKVSSEQGSEPVQGTETKTENEQYFLRNRNRNEN